MGPLLILPGNYSSIYYHSKSREESREGKGSYLVWACKSGFLARGNKVRARQR